MIIDNLDVFRSALFPSKAHSPLIIDSDAVLALLVAGQSLKAISGNGTRSSSFSASSSIRSFRRATLMLPNFRFVRSLTRGFEEPTRNEVRKQSP